AVVWIASAIVVGCAPAEADALTVRPSADTMPWLTLPVRPSGLPMASTIWPAFTSSELPNVATFRLLASLSTRMTARSPAGNVPMTLAFTDSPPVAGTTSTAGSLPTTWAWVMMSPEPSNTTPDPVALLVKICTTDGSTAATTLSY